MGPEGLMPLEFDHIICCIMMSLDHEAAHGPYAWTKCLLIACWSSYICTNKHYIYKDCWIDRMSPDCPSVNCTKLVSSHLSLYFLCTSYHYYSSSSHLFVCLLLCHYPVVLLIFYLAHFHQLHHLESLYPSSWKKSLVGSLQLVWQRHSTNH